MSAARLPATGRIDGHGKEPKVLGIHERPVVAVDERLIGGDHNRLVPDVELVGEAANACVLLYVCIRRVERRKAYVIAAAQQNRTGRSEQVEGARRAVADNYASTCGHHNALGARIDGDNALRRPDEYERLAALFDGARAQRLQYVDIRVEAFVDVETGALVRVGHFDQCLLNHLAHEYQKAAIRIARFSGRE